LEQLNSSGLSFLSYALIASRNKGEEMTAQEPTIQETLKKDQITFQEILSDDELDALFIKHNV
jgi:hypothetical protein